MSDVPTYGHPSLVGAGAGLAGRPEDDADLDGFVDPDLDRDADRELDPLALLAEIAAPVVVPEVIVPHRFRPPWAVQYSTALDLDDLKRWQKRATPPGNRGQVDEVRLACIVLANLCKAILRNGEPVLDLDGAPLTFAHPAVWQTYQAKRAADAVRKFYGNDPYLAATLDAVLAAAGIGDEVETLDPTRPSSD